MPVDECTLSKDKTKIIYLTSLMFFILGETMHGMGENSVHKQRHTASATWGKNKFRRALEEATGKQSVIGWEVRGFLSRPAGLVLQDEVC